VLYDAQPQRAESRSLDCADKSREDSMPKLSGLSRRLFHTFALPSALLVLFSVCAAQPAGAAPITYQISSVASGQIGATTFTNAQIDLIGTGDTANVVALTDFGIPFPVFANPFITFTVTIGGVITATITDPSTIWSIPDVIPGFNPVPLVIFGRIDAPPALDSITGIGFFGSNALAGYDLSTGIGPIPGPGEIDFNPNCSTPGNDPCLHTSLGLLRISSGGLESQGTFVATPAPVPEPATLFLLGSGAAALVGRSRFRTRRSGEK
jgi:PEP-CTERM motif